MRKLIDDLNERFRSFVEQRDDFALVVGCSSSDTLLIFKVLEGLGDANTRGLFWTSIVDFTTPASFVDAIVGMYALKHDGVRLTLQEQGKPTWPIIPESILSSQAPPVERMRSLLAFSRSLLPYRSGAVTVWNILPLEIENPAEYGKFMSDVLRHDFPFPWCHHLRVIVRDDPVSRPLRHALKNAPRTQWYDADLSLEAAEKSLEAEAGDASAPLDQRMGALMIMATLDATYKRFADAEEKFNLLVEYHTMKGNNPLVALSLNGLGEVRHRLNDRDGASKYYEAALEPASAAVTASPIFLNVTMNLARLRAEQERWPEAEAFSDSSEKLALLLRNPAARILALESQGVAQERQKKMTEAIVSWQLAAEIAERANERDLGRSVLEKLEAAFRKSKQIDDANRAAARRNRLAKTAPQPAGQPTATS